MARAGLGLGLHDLLYGSEFLSAFDYYWEYAKRNYNRMQAGRILGSPTMYYDPLIPCHHPIGESHNFSFGTAHGLMPLYPDDARTLYEDAIDKLKWREMTFSGEEYGADPMASFVLLMGQFLAGEFGDDALHAKLKIRSDAYDEPNWNPDTCELTWGFGLGEHNPRGQMNATAALADAAIPGAWASLISQPHQERFLEPTVYGVDFPKVCLSQAFYDAAHRMLVISTDAGVPKSAGNETTLRIMNIDPNRCAIEIDGIQCDSWRVIKDDIEISTTVDEHIILVHIN